MGRRSTIESHPQRDAIERALLEGATAVDVSARFSVSESAISRWKKLHYDALAAVVQDDSTAPDDLLIRLRELADSTRSARKLADLTGSPAVRARSATAELAVIDRLISRAGITDLSTVDLMASTGALLRAVQGYVLKYPEHAPDLFALMGEHPDLIQLRDILRGQLRKQKTA